MKLYKITKLGSVENPHHENSTFGESMPYHLGYFINPPEIGERFNLQPYSYKRGEEGISTSAVTKIIDENTFETLNSVYRFERVLEDDENRD